MVLDANFYDKAFHFFRDELEPFDCKAFFFELVHVSEREVVKGFGRVEHPGIFVLNDSHRKTIHEFDWMVPDAAHFSIYVPSKVREATILMAYHVYPVSSSNVRAAQVFSISLNALLFGGEAGQAFQRTIL